jgi:hypothetical protein
VTAEVVLADLLARLDTSDPDGCWLVPGASARYPSVYVEGRVVLVSHLLLAVGPGQVRRHTCDLRRCVNRRHLVTGTRADNSRDMVDRGRSLRGERSPTAKLTDDQARTLRRRLTAGETGRALAREYGVSQATVSLIRHRRAWAHV